MTTHPVPDYIDFESRRIPLGVASGDVEICKAIARYAAAHRWKVRIVEHLGGESLDLQPDDLEGIPTWQPGSQTLALGATGYTYTIGDPGNADKTEPDIAAMMLLGPPAEAEAITPTLRDALANLFDTLLDDECRVVEVPADYRGRVYNGMCVADYHTHMVVDVEGEAIATGVDALHAQVCACLRMALDMAGRVNQVDRQLREVRDALAILRSL